MEKMKYVNRIELKGEMAKKGITKEKLATLLNCSRPSIINKIEHNGSFSESEIAILSETFSPKIFEM